MVFLGTNSIESQFHSYGDSGNKLSCQKLLRDLLIFPGNASTDLKSLLKAVCHIGLTDAINFVPVLTRQFKVCEVTKTIVSSDVDDVLRQANLTRGEATQAIDSISQAYQDYGTIRQDVDMALDIINRFFAHYH